VPTRPHSHITLAVVGRAVAGHLIMELTHNPAVNSLRRQVARHVVEPETPPESTNLAVVLGLIDVLLHANVRVGGVLVDETPGISDGRSRDYHEKENLPRHAPPPCWVVPRPAVGSVGSVGCTV
jgi:hypothetical protein